MVCFYMKVPVTNEDNVCFVEVEPVRIPAAGFGGMLLIESEITHQTLLRAFRSLQAKCLRIRLVVS